MPEMPCPCFGTWQEGKNEMGRHRRKEWVYLKQRLSVICLLHLKLPHWCAFMPSTALPIYPFSSQLQCHLLLILCLLFFEGSHRSCPLFFAYALPHEYVSVAVILGRILHVTEFIHDILHIIWSAVDDGRDDWNC